MWVGGWVDGREGGCTRKNSQVELETLFPSCLKEGGFGRKIGSNVASRA